MNGIMPYVINAAFALLFIGIITLIQLYGIKDYDRLLEYRKGYLKKPYGEPVDDTDIMVAEERKALRERLFREYQTRGEVK